MVEAEASRSIGSTRIFIGDDHHSAAIQWKRHRQHGVGRAGERRTPVQARHKFRLAHILDVENHEAAVPVAGIEPVAETQRMMAAMRAAFPGRLFAAGSPLSRHPPAADFFGFRLVFQIENHHDVAEITVYRGRDIGVTTVEI